MKLYIASDDHEHAILVADEDSNDIAEFFHSDHATVGQSYETALMLANALIAAASTLASHERYQAESVPQAAIENLTNHQVQCDQDGVMIQVSRQALDEVLAYVALTRPLRGGDQ